MRIEDVKRLTATFYRVTREDMEGERRARRWAWPRQVGMALSRQYTGKSMPEIGRRFGGRDHTTVLHAIRSVRRRVAEDSDICQDIVWLCAQIESGAITVPSTWPAEFADKLRPLATAPVFIESAALPADIEQALESRRPDGIGRVDHYATALRRVGVGFRPRADCTSPLSVWPLPGSRVLLLRGPGAFSPEAA
jgi:hypothetical protein